MEEGKQEIINRFDNNVRGRKPDTSNINQDHDGKAGHWLEHQMGIKINNKTEADLFGYEMKNQTTSGKITFGDWSADYYIFKDYKYFTSGNTGVNRDCFMQIFGTYKLDKGRYSWSGEVTPKIKNFNRYGQKLIITENKDITAIYSYDQDSRQNKKDIIPVNMQINDLILARWTSNSMKKRVESKFNDKGWFKCLQNSLGVYTNIQFGKPITFESWIDLVAEGVVFFDSGMYQGNNRPYSQWRALNNFWDSLIIETY
ncbi:MULTISPECIES: LlaMI family restriction endonuclease [Pseudanabaena]|uniref:Type II site-specific deoxyribonuclease n=2 Tax=Pseudanabaena TaxID=1152 RepID=L8MZ19_9CYAN|nr:MULTISPECIES: LlaMI family restriction endonuclease [Pseudanabaena]ELS32039.1 Type II site-specific deoxyribonuclease [Pseudanabaena biceps PCC 7429]MDG3495724.1 LlaMI family restriction endonuclease [Pseudanabaena catenata USMAC16]